MKKNYPVMILKKISLMPFQDIRLDLDSEASSSIINLSITKYDANILISCPRNTNEEAPDVRDLPNSAVLSSIKSKIILPNGNIRLVVSGLKRVNITEYFGDEEGLKAKVSDIKDEEISEVDEQTLRRKIISLLKKYIETSSKMSNSIVNLIKGIDSLDRLTDTVIPFLPFNTEKKINCILSIFKPDFLVDFFIVALFDVSEEESVEESVLLLIAVLVEFSTGSIGFTGSTVSIGSVGFTPSIESLDISSDILLLLFI